MQNFCGSRWTLFKTFRHLSYPFFCFNLSLQTTEAPFLEPFVRSFILGMGAGALLEGAHVAIQVMTHSFPGVSQYSPLLVADHVTAFASWIALYTIEAVAIMAVLKRNDWKSGAAVAEELRNVTTLPRKLLRQHRYRHRGLFNFLCSYCYQPCSSHLWCGNHPSSETSFSQET